MEIAKTLPSNPIKFTAKLLKIDSWTIIRLPKNASKNLPSRGMAMINGTINAYSFQAPLEPDGMGSHWFKVENDVLKGSKSTIGGRVTLQIEPSKEWPEPEVPQDLKKTLDAAPQANSTWKDITPFARWEWIRWIRSTKNPETRQRRIEVARSKLDSGKRRPCCFNSSECTVPDVSHKGILMGEIQE